MKDFRRSVIHLFLGTFFLLFIAWVGVKAMQYHGDYERMIQDAQRFLRENGLVEFFRGKVIPFFQEKVIPFLQGIGDSVKSIKYDMQVCLQAKRRPIKASLIHIQAWGGRSFHGDALLLHGMLKSLVEVHVVHPV